MKQIFYGRHTINASDIDAVVEVLKHRNLTQGDSVSRFEKEIKTFCHTPYAVAVSSGTAALHTAMFAIGIKPGDEVITTPLSFAATANCVCYLGATPVFADVVYETGLLDPEAVEKKITERTKAIIAVDYAGQPSYFRELREIARRHHLALIDDASHSLGGTYHQEPIGSQADITIFSFHPVKTITTGEGGMLMTGHEEYYRRAVLFRTHGITKDPRKFFMESHRILPWYYEMQELGFNYRLTDFQCVLGISQMKRIDRFIEKRRKIASLYAALLERSPKLKPYREREGSQSSWHLYPLRIIDKEVDKIGLFDLMKKNGVNLQVHYIPIHLHPFYRSRFGYKPGDFPSAERFYDEELTLPLYVDLTFSQVRRVVDLLHRFIR